MAASVVVGLTDRRTDRGVSSWLELPTARARLDIWQAIGCLTIQRGLSTTDAFAALRAQAFGAGQDIEQAAADVIAQYGPRPGTQA